MIQANRPQRRKPDKESLPTSCLPRHVHSLCQRQPLAIRTQAAFFPRWNIASVPLIEAASRILSFSVISSVRLDFLAPTLSIQLHIWPLRSVFRKHGSAFAGHSTFVNTVFSTSASIHFPSTFRPPTPIVWTQCPSASMLPMPAFTSTPRERSRRRVAGRGAVPSLSTSRP